MRKQVRAFLGLWSVPTVAVIIGVTATVYGLHQVWAPLPYLALGPALLALSAWLLGAPVPRRRTRG